MSETKEERHARIKTRLAKNKFMMNAEGAIEASRSGLCGRCGESRATNKYSTTIFYRTIWGPARMPMSEQGHNVNIHLCEDCYLDDLKEKIIRSKLSIGNTLNNIDSMEEKLEEILNKRNV